MAILLQSITILREKYVIGNCVPVVLAKENALVLYPGGLKQATRRKLCVINVALKPNQSIKYSCSTLMVI
jgi:hypothetical protein